MQDVWARSVYPLAARMGVKMILPRVSPQPYTHLAFEGFQFAKERGKPREYNYQVFKAFFQEGLNIGSPDVLTQIAGDVGLDSVEFRKALESRRYNAAHQQALANAYNARITSVPTTIIGNHILPGLLNRETLEQIIHQENSTSRG